MLGNLSATQAPVLELLAGKKMVGFSLGSITRGPSLEDKLAIMSAVMELLDKKVIQPLTGMRHCTPFDV